MATADTQRSTSNLFLRALLPILILGGGIFAFFAISDLFKKESPRFADPTAAVHVQVALVGAHQQGMALEADGIVVPYREIKISSEVAGRVIERSEICRAGNYVKKGDLLVTIDPQDYQIDVERLEQEVEQASVSLDELNEEIQGAESLITIAEQELALRTRELKRMQNLGRAVSASDLEKTEVAELAARNALVTLRNRVRLLSVSRGRLESARDLSGSNLKKARLDLQRTQVFAPVEGVIVSDFIEQDSYVQRGTLLLMLEDTAKAEVKCKLQMEDLYWLWDLSSLSAGNAPTTAADAYNIPEANAQVVFRLTGHNDLEYVWQGRLTRFDGLGLDERTRTVPCRVVVDHPRQRISTHSSGPPALLRGMYVTIRIQVAPRTPLLDVPEVAVRPGNKVWRVRNGKLAIVPVNFIALLESDEGSSTASREALIYVDDPSLLTAEDLVVTSPLTSVRTGMEVQVSESNERAGP